jgi:hypothetical protein
VSIIKARELAADLGGWAAGDDGIEPETAPWVIDTAVKLVSVLADLDRRAEFRRLWDLPGRPFARTGGRCLHSRDCRRYVFRPGEHDEAHLIGHQPLTASQAEAFLRESRERRRCAVCKPDIPEPTWVQVRSGNGVRWRLADDVELP